MKSDWIKSSIYSLLQKFTIPAFGLGNYVILARVLAEDILGVWIIYLSITTLIEGVMIGLIKNAMVTYLNSTEEAFKKIRSSSLMLNISLTIVISIILLVGAKALAWIFKSSQLVELFIFYIAILWALIPYLHFSVLLQAKSQFKGIFWGNLLRYGVFFLLIVSSITLANSISLLTLAKFQLISVLASVGVLFLFVRKDLFFQIAPQREWLSKLWKFGRFGLMTNLSNTIFLTTDHLMLGGLLSSASVSLYNAAARITNVFNLPSVALAEVLLPKSARLQERSQLKAMYEKTVGTLIAVSIPVMLIVILASELLLLIIAGDKYTGASFILQINIFNILLMPFMKQFGVIVNALNRPNIDFYYVLFLSILNIVMNLVFIELFGLIGAAYGTLLSYVIGVVVSQILLRKMIGVSTSGVMKEMAGAYPNIFKLVFKRLT